MARPTHYVPCIRRELVSALYHEARHRRQPMTTLVDELLTKALRGSHGWQIAQHASDLQEQTRQDHHAKAS